jgi:hypothetical protein
MKSYAWSCFACDAANPAERTHCVQCGCPARATSPQVDDARQTWRRRSGLPPLAGFDVVGMLRGLPLLLIGAGAFALLGSVALIVSAGASYGALAAFGALLLALAALCLSSYRRPASG